MRLATESSAQSESLREDHRHVQPLRVVRASDGLQVGEPRAVLDVEQGLELERPRDDVRATGELEVLIGLVDRNGVPQVAKSRRLDLGHGGVHEIDLAVDGSALGRVGERQIQPHPERVGEACVRVDRPDSSGFDAVNSGRRETGALRQRLEAPPSPRPLFTNDPADRHG
jgi:hypothetical protein